MKLVVLWFGFKFVFRGLKGLRVELASLYKKKVAKQIFPSQ